MSRVSFLVSSRWVAAWLPVTLLSVLCARAPSEGAGGEAAAAKAEWPLLDAWRKDAPPRRRERLPDGSLRSAFPLKAPLDLPSARGEKVLALGDMTMAGGFPAADGGGAGGTACTACRAGSVACGTPATGNLGPGDCTIQDNTFIEVWSFELAASGRITFELLSTAFDTYLFVANAACDVLATNDDCTPGDFDRSCVSLNLAAGSYFIVANTFAEGERGAYTLRVTCPAGGPLCTSCSPLPIACGETGTGALAAGDCTLPEDGSFLDFWRLTLQEPATVRATLSSSDLDPFLIIYDEACEIVSFNDDCTAGDLSLACVTVSLPAGTYYLGANSFSAGETGPYELRVDCSAFRDPCADCIAGSIACNTTVAQSLSSDDCVLFDGSFLDTWTFDLEADATVTFELASTDVDPYLFVLSSGCEVVAENDDCTEGDFELSCVTAQLARGSYLLAATSFAPGEIGSYTLAASSADCVPAPPSCTECSDGTISCGESLTSELRDEPCVLDGAGPADFWRLDLEARATVVVTLESAELDPLTAILDADCQEIARNDDCQGTLNSCLRREVEAGTYYIVASSAFVDQSGAYSLNVRCEGGAGGRVVPGDSNGNGTLEISDAVYLLGFLFRGTGDLLPCGDGSLSDPSNVSLADWDGEGSVNLSDGIGLLSYLFRRGAEHVLGADACVVLAGCPETCPPVK